MELLSDASLFHQYIYISLIQILLKAAKMPLSLSLSLFLSISLVHSPSSRAHILSIVMQRWRMIPLTPLFSPTVFSSLTRIHKKYGSRHVKHLTQWQECVGEVRREIRATSSTGFELLFGYVLFVLNTDVIVYAACEDFDLVIGEQKPPPIIAQSEIPLLM